MLKIELSIFKRALKFMGYDPSDGSFGLQVNGSKLIIAGLFVNSIYYINSNWSNEDKRADGIKTAMYASTAFIYNSMYTSNWKNSIMLVNIIEAGPYTGPCTVPDKRNILIKTLNREMVNLNTAWWVAVMSHTLQCFLLPIIMFTFKVLMSDNSQEVDYENYFLSLAWYYPFGYRAFPAYVFGYLVQSIVVLYGTLYATLIVSSSINVMKLIQGECRSLRLSIEEMESSISHHRNPITKALESGRIYDGDVSKDFDTKAMLYFMKCLVEHHNVVYRKVIQITEGMGIMMVFVNAINGIFICSTIVKLVQTSDTLSKITEVAFLCLMVFRFFCYDYVGESVMAEDENIRKALYDLPWMYLPKWFNQNIQIMMVRCNRQIEIKPAGLFELNLRNTSRTLNAIYSYYNVLNSFKK